jgi:hypothetical protein
MNILKQDENDFIKGWKIGKIYDQQVRAYWQEKYLDNIIYDLEKCIEGTGG